MAVPLFTAQACVSALSVQRAPGRVREPSGPQPALLHSPIMRGWGRESAVSLFPLLCHLKLLTTIIHL